MAERADDIQLLAEQLGLAYKRRLRGAAYWMSGQVKGRSIEATSIGAFGPVARCAIRPALDLGVSVMGRQSSSSLADWSGERVVVGDHNWDGELWSYADDADRGRALLIPEVRAPIMALNIRASSFSITDGVVRASYVGGAGEIRAVLEMLIRIADRIDGARAGVPAAGALAGHAAALERIAGARGLSFSATPLRLEGESEEHRVDVLFTRAAMGKYRFSLHVAAREARPFGLLVRRQTLADGVRKLLGAEDVEVGDAVFDRAFLVQGREPQRVKNALDAGARAALLDLARRFEGVLLDDMGLRVEGPAGQVPPGDLAALLATAEGLVDQVARASSVEARGPYR